VNATAQAEAEMAIMAAGWRTVGFEVREIPVPQAQARLGEVRGTFPTFYTGGGGVGDRALPSFLSSTIASAETRWVGNNRTGFSNPAFDRLAEAYATTLDRTERQRQLTEMARIFSEELPAISLYFNPGIVAFAAALHGPLPFGPDADVSWNVHEWELR
jgi:peptide/nickel transport system substrate-binding protein